MRSLFFFFSSRRRHTRCGRDWSSDVCSSDLMSTLPKMPNAMALAFGIFGSVDMNRGDLLLGWDTDQFPNSVPEVTLGLYAILQAGGLTTGGMDFDAKLRHPSIDTVDLVHIHVGGMGLCARVPLA